MNEHFVVHGLLLPKRGLIFDFFVFSSRRRHTRSYGDWSSDVCSSDLLIVETLHEHYAGGGREFDDLDDLAGAWSPAEASAFEAAVAPFAAVDAGLWARSGKPA